MNRDEMIELVNTKLRRELTSSESLTNVIADLVMEVVDVILPDTDAGAGEGEDSGDGPEL